MQVFKLYFKLLKGQYFSFLIYAVVFSGLVLTLTSSRTDNEEAYMQSKIKVAVVNYNEDSSLVQGLLANLEDYCEFIDIGDAESDLEDALFYRQVEYILTIPYDFGDEFIAGKNVMIEKKTIPDAIYATTVDAAVNMYLNTARIYLNTIPGLDQEELVSYIDSDLNAQAETKMEKENAHEEGNTYYNYFMNITSYVLLAGCLIGVSQIMITFHNINIKRRNMVAPITFKNLNIQLIGGNIVFVLAYDVLLIIIGLLSNPDKTITGNVLLIWLNLIMFSISALSISYLVAMLIKSRQATEAIAMVLPLGLAFISGAFVPQFLLSESVLHLASFQPQYWFIKANDAIAKLTVFNSESLPPIFYFMAIQLGFAIAFFTLSLVISKSRMQKEN